MCQTTENRAVKAKGFTELYPAGSFIGLHEHRAGQIAHAISGVMRIHAGENMWILPPGRVLWIPPRVRHCIECHGDVAMRTVYVDGPLPFPSPPLGVWQISGLMREVILRFSSGTDRAHRRLLTELLLAEMQICISLPLKLPLPAERRMRALCGSLLKDLSARHDLEQTVKRLGLSKRTFIRKFQKETGMTFRHWQLQARMLVSIEELSQGTTVAAAAYAAGYESASAYAAAFKRCFAMSPSAYGRVHASHIGPQ